MSSEFRFQRVEGFVEEDGDRAPAFFAIERVEGEAHRADRGHRDEPQFGLALGLRPAFARHREQGLFLRDIAGLLAGLHRRAGAGWAFARSFLWFLFQPVWQEAPPGGRAAGRAGGRAAGRPGGYYGPNRLSKTRGYPAQAKIPPAALDRGAVARLWEASETLTGARIG